MIYSTIWAIRVLAAISMICASQVQESRAAATSSPVSEAVRRALSDGIKGDSANLKKAMGEIDRELASDVDLNEVEPNLEHVLELLDEAKDYSGVDTGRLDALQLLAALKHVWDGTLKCGHESYTILAKINQALGGKVTQASKQQSSQSRSLSIVVRKIALKHAQECKQICPEIYNQLVQQFPPDAHVQVKVFLDLLVEVHIKRSERPGWSLFGGNSNQRKLTPDDALNAPLIISSYTTLVGKDEANIAYDFLREYVRDDPDQWYLTRVPVSETDNRLVLNTDKIGQLFRRHLVTPCQQYMDLLGPTVFEPAGFDAQLLGPDDDNHQNVDLVDYQKARIRYNLCKKLVQRDEKALLKGIVAVAREAPINQFNY